MNPTPKIPAKLFLKGALLWGGAMFLIFQAMITVLVLILGLIVGQVDWPMYAELTTFNLGVWALGGLAWSALTFYLGTHVERGLSKWIDAVLPTILDPEERVAFRAPSVWKKGWRTIYGEFLVTNRRLLFVAGPGWWQRQAGRRTLPRNDVQSVHLASRSVLPFRAVEDETGASLVLVTKGGEETAFFVAGRPGVVDEVRRAVFQ